MAAQGRAEEAEARRAAEITTACDLAEQGHRAPGFIAMGLSLSDVLCLLLEETEAKAIWDKQVAQHNAQFEIRH